MSTSTEIVSPLLNTRQAAAYLGLRPSTLARWRTSGGGPAFTPLGSRLIYYQITALDAFIASRVCRSTTEHRAKHPTAPPRKRRKPAQPRLPLGPGPKQAG